jgi:dTDP-glucose 4,6-dehydratase
MSDHWEGKQVLVTGAGGFIGSHLVEALLSRGAKVRAFIRYTSRKDPGMLRHLANDDFSKLKIVAGDLRDENAVRQAVKDCQTVFHLGALISIPYSYLHPVEVASTNFMGTLNILAACRDLGVERVVHTSTSEVYGTARTVPMTEDHPLQAQSPYSASKIGADKIAESFYCAYNLPVVTVRPFNTFGPRQSARAVIPAIITQALTQDSIQLGNLATTRDFTYVTDTVQGFILAAETQGVEGQVFNLGTGHEISIGELAQKIPQMIVRPVEVKVDSQRLRPDASEVLRLVSDNSLSIQKLMWNPKYTLEHGLEKTIDWIRDHLDQYRVGTYEF